MLDVWFWLSHYLNVCTYAYRIGLHLFEYTAIYSAILYCRSVYLNTWYKCLGFGRILAILSRW